MDDKWGYPYFRKPPYNTVTSTGKTCGNCDLYLGTPGRMSRNTKNATNVKLLANSVCIYVGSSSNMNSLVAYKCWNCNIIRQRDSSSQMSTLGQPLVVLKNIIFCWVWLCSIYGQKEQRIQLRILNGVCTMAHSISNGQNSTLDDATAFAMPMGSYTWHCQAKTSLKHIETQ